MSNYGAKILNNSISSLRAHQALLTVTGNNIANVNTPGFTKRNLQLEIEPATTTNGRLQVGSGVSLGNVTRQSDEFINRLLREAVGEKGRADVKDEFLSRLQNNFDLTGKQMSIGGALTDFFSAMKDLAQNPASTQFRTNAVERTRDLVEVINVSYNSAANLQEEADSRLVNELNSANTILKQIAEVNGRIVAQEFSGNLAADERDKRDILLKQLSEKISFQATEVNDGSINIYLTNGFTLVHGVQHNSLETTKSPSFTAGSPLKSLSGSALSFIVHNYGEEGSPAHVDLSSIIAAGSGTLAGLLSVRGVPNISDTSPFQAGGAIVDTAARIDALARQLLTTFNQTYAGDDGDTTTVGFQPGSGDLNGNSPGAYGLFDFDFSGVKDADGNNIADDLTASGLTNFAGRLIAPVTNPRDLALSHDLLPNDPLTSFASGDGTIAARLAALEQTSLTFNSGGGSYSFTGTSNEQYNELVTNLGGEVSSAKLTAKSAEDSLTVAEARRDEVSGVSLDEEFANLIRFQKGYQASARLIKLTDDMLQQIVTLL